MKSSRHISHIHHFYKPYGNPHMLRLDHDIVPGPNLLPLRHIYRITLHNFLDKGLRYG
jgi:hypothetical protein